MPAKDVAPTRAWLMMGSTGSTPGVLQVAGGRLVYTAHGRGALTGGQLRGLEEQTGRPGLADQLSGGARVALLDVPVEEIGRVRFPWYYFGAGMKLTVGGTGYRFSFVKPQNTSDDEFGVLDVPAGRATGRSWRAALTAAP